MRVDDFLGRRFNAQTYSCVHFVRDVWLELTGENIEAPLRRLLVPAGERRLTAGTFRAFRRLARPEPPAIAFMTALGHDPHIGVVIPGGMIHLRTHGVEYFPLDIATRGFTHVRFYR